MSGHLLDHPGLSNKRAQILKYRNIYFSFMIFLFISDYVSPFLMCSDYKIHTLKLYMSAPIPLPVGNGIERVKKMNE